jgi:preprotein translocase SecE subunit
MSRNRQRAKQRQAERRAARLGSTRPESSQPDPTPAADQTAADEEEALEQAELAAGAPPADLGFSDATLEAEEEADFAEADLEADELEEEEAEAAEPRERRRARADGTPAHGRRRHNRLVSFLIAVVAELRRVEWPDRQTLTMLTGVVLLFVIVMGAYLGLLDAVFSKVIDKIL